KKPRLPEGRRTTAAAAGFDGTLGVVAAPGAVFAIVGARGSECPVKSGSTASASAALGLASSASPSSSSVGDSSPSGAASASTGTIPRATSLLKKSASKTRAQPLVRLAQLSSTSSIFFKN